MNLIVDFDLSSCKLEDNQRNFIKQLSEEKDFKKILGADVEPHFKIAKILCNQLGWRIEFDYNRDLSYKVFIPMTQRPSEEEELALADENVQVVVEEEENRPAPLIQQERVIASQQS